MTRRALTLTVCLAGLLVLFLCVRPVIGAEQQKAEARQELSPELRRLLDELDAANAEVEALTARVQYERSIPLLEEKEKSRGRLVFRKPDLLHLELGKPRHEEVWCDGETWWVVSHDDRQVEVYPASEDAGPETAFLDFGYGKGSEVLLEDYSVEIASRERKEQDGESYTEYRLRFTARPTREDESPPRYATIEVESSSRRWLPHTLVLHESGGEILHTYRLSRLKLNPDLDEDRFEYEPPRGYTVLHPAEE